MKNIGLVLAAALVCGLGIGAGFSVAQTYPPAIVTNVSGSADLVQVIPNGTPKVQSQYAYAGQVGAVEKFVNGGTISTDPAYTFPNGLTLWTGHAAGTITTVTLTTEPNPSNGKRECYVLDQITSTLTWTANTGQTIGTNVKAAGALGIPVCIIYQTSNATWYASN